MGQWIRNNLVLVAGILLPVLLVVGFGLLQTLPRAITVPPQHDFLVVGYSYPSGDADPSAIQFDVRDGRLRARLLPQGEAPDRRYRQRARLYRYRVGDGVFDEIPFDPPSLEDPPDEAVTFPITGVQALSLSADARSPDGYVFEYAGHRSGGLLGEMFGMGRRGSPWVLRRDSARHELPRPPAEPFHYGNDVEFLAWVLTDPVMR